MSSSDSLSKGQSVSNDASDSNFTDSSFRPAGVSDSSDSRSYPRIFARLNLAVLQKPAVELAQVKYNRMQLLQKIQDAAENISSFPLSDFILGIKQASAEYKIIEKNYLEFLREVTKVTDEHDAARDMFSIIRKNRDSKEGARTAAYRYFGDISMAQFVNIFKIGKDLCTYHKDCRDGSSTNSGSTGTAALPLADIPFNQPYIPTVSSLLKETGIERFLKSREDSVDKNPRPKDQSPHDSNHGNIDINNNSDSSISSHANWLLRLCRTFLQTSNDNPLSEYELAAEVMSIFSSTKKDIKDVKSERFVDVFQAKIFDLFGELAFEYISELVQNIDKVKLITVGQLKTPVSSESYGSGKKFKIISANQQRKIEEKDKDDERRREEEKYLPSLQGHTDALEAAGFDPKFIEDQRLLGLQKAKDAEITGRYNKWHKDMIATFGYEHHDPTSLPAGAKRTTGKGFEEIHIPAKTRDPMLDDVSTLKSIDDIDPWAQGAFKGTTRLNRIQSEVFETAYNSTENMLVCAPTGAGKTNIAMLTFLQYVKGFVEINEMGNFEINKEEIKAIYVAPMKALAQEVVSKFSERLKPLGMNVRELTGDMQLTKQEVADSQLIVTTPEKYDVITRKGGEGSLGTLVSLIILDEIHLLADTDRGPVIESIISRTLRYVESSQKVVRLVGLSATLPNYKDVALFLGVNQKSGMFYFGPEYRPVPLDQTFVGITEKNKVQQREFMNIKAYEKMIIALKNGKQVMIFVHSRKETSKTLDELQEMIDRDKYRHLFENVDHPKFLLFKKDVDKSKNAQVQEFFRLGMGIHHAGMLRPDRTLSEMLFEQGLIKVLCCTSTLAWGVNLPAHTVIIKGTELYDPERGGVVDVSILDVLQIFGRAGRPQYDSTGHGIIITTHKSFPFYLGLLGNHLPIESGLIKSVCDHLNAEIVNGTVNNITEGVQWLSYTFLYIRMMKNPMVYGISLEERIDDPLLEGKRLQIIKQAAEKLDMCRMVRYDERSGNLAVTDLGRIASHYYIKHGTIESFNNMLLPHLQHADALHVLCSSAEFDQLKVRPEEIDEIDRLKLNNSSIAVKKSSADDTAGKVNVLLQSYLNSSKVESFTLQSDINYISSNSGRISRALFEICLRRGWSSLATFYLELSKCIDRRVTVEQSPLRQFYELPFDIVKKIEDMDVDVYSFLDSNEKDVSLMIRNSRYGGLVQQLVRYLPALQVECSVQPITRGILRMSLEITIDFEWSDKHHGAAEPFWLWIEDGDNEYIYHSEHFILHKKMRKEIHAMEFTIPVREPMPNQYFIRINSDKWVGCGDLIPVSFKHLILPDRMPPHTDLLDIHPVPVTALKNSQFEKLYSNKFSHFNPIQSQVFHILYNTDSNILIGAPTGSGKTIIGEFAILRLFAQRPKAKCVYVAPLKALARERLLDWQRKLGGILGMSILELTGDFTPDMSALMSANLLIVTPEKWDSISRGWKHRDYVKQVELLIIDEIHLLGVDRGPVLEVIVSRLRIIASQTKQPMRFVGLSTALANPRDLADWLGIKDVGVVNFRPSVRPVPMTIHIQGFPGKHYCPRMATMNKPCYAAIIEHSPTKPTLIFVSSRRQTRLTALDLISYCASDDTRSPKQFLNADEDEMEAIVKNIKDSSLKDTLLFGIGIHHAGLDSTDRSIVEQLYLDNKIQVLVCTATLAWGVNLPCHLVIVKGSEFYDGKTKRYVDMPVTDILQMIGRAGRPQFDDTGISCVFVAEPKKVFYKKFLHEPFPVESSLHLQLCNHINAEIRNKVINNCQDCIQYLSWTYFFRRLIMNPSYYQLFDLTPEGVREYLVSMIMDTTYELEEAGCITTQQNKSDGGEFKSTILGAIASYYYLNYKTIGLFKKGIHDTNFLSHFYCNYTSMTTATLKKESASSSSSSINSGIIAASYLLCNAFEFSELPVRHNEDLLNEDLALQLPWPVNPGTYFNTSRADANNYHSNYNYFRLNSSESRFKAFLLLQAHIYRIPMPISDYINDLKSFLDQVPRVLNALIDITAASIIVGGNELNTVQFDIINCLIMLSQMIYQGLHYQQNTLLQLPFIGTSSDNNSNLMSKKEHKRGNSGKDRTFDALSRLESEFKVSNIRDLINFIKQGGEASLVALAGKLLPAGGSGKMKDDFVRVASELNRAKISCRLGKKQQQQQQHQHQQQLSNLGQESSAGTEATSTFSAFPSLSSSITAAKSKSDIPADYELNFEFESQDQDDATSAAASTQSPLPSSHETLGTTWFPKGNSNSTTIDLADLGSDDIVIEFTINGVSNGKPGSTFTPRYHKSKSPAYYLVVSKKVETKRSENTGAGGGNEFILVRRLGRISKSTKVIETIKLASLRPNDVKDLSGTSSANCNLVAHLMSDCIMGTDVEVDISISIV